MISLFNWIFLNKTRAVIIAILWTALILFACFIPGNEVPNIKIPLIDKWVHFIIFAGFSFFWLACYKQPQTKHYVAYAVLAFLFGYLVEVLQGSGITTGRSFEWNDVWADGIGGIIGSIIFALLYSLSLKRKKENI